MPLALVGGFVALWIFSIPLSVSAAIGFIALSGQAVLNGVVMLSVFQQFEASGMSVADAVRNGSMARLRTVDDSDAGWHSGCYQWRFRTTSAPRHSDRWRLW